MTMMPGSMLLVEDDPNDILLMERAVRKAGISVPLGIVRDGEEAVAYLSGSSKFADRDSHPLPVFILLDLKLPKLSGFEVLRWLRAQPELRRIPVIVFTSSKEKHDIARTYDLGANAYLIKPAAFNDLVELVKTISLFWMFANQYSDVAPDGIMSAHKPAPWAHEERRRGDRRVRAH